MGAQKDPPAAMEKVALADGWTFRVDGLVKRFGTLAANDGITLRVDPGEVYGLLGPNGAGKSTLVKQTIGLLKPTSGRPRRGSWAFAGDSVD
jgi:ABC-type sugar transport system ATPase subunit